MTSTTAPVTRATLPTATLSETVGAIADVILDPDHVQRVLDTSFSWGVPKRIRC